jgi:hypothetical protein
LTPPLSGLAACSFALCAEWLDPSRSLPDNLSKVKTDITFGFLDLSNIHKVETFNFIFNLGDRKSSGGDKPGEYGKGVVRGCNIFRDQKLANIHSFVGGSVIVQKISKIEILLQNPKNNSIKNVLLPFLMRFDGHLLLNRQQQQYLPKFELIMGRQLSHHLLPVPFLVEVVYAT